MEKLVIEGGTPLHGRVRISGAKNAALPAIAATLLVGGKHELRNVPDLRDTRTILRLLSEMGVTNERVGNSLFIDSSNLSSTEASYDLVKTMRASVLVLGPLIARKGKAKISLPGGCAIGARPIDYHIAGFEKLGVTCTLENGYVEASISGSLKGDVIYFDIPSVTATENLLTAAVLAEGTTVIKNAAREPEVSNLVDMLISMGAIIEGRGSDKLTIHGVKSLKPANIDIIPDRIEAGTYLIAIAATCGHGSITHCNPSHLPSLIEKLRASGVILEESETEISVDATGFKGINKGFGSVDITTRPYPGYPTDLQAQFMAMMTLSSGVSVVNETIFENRFMHVEELNRMGANIHVEGNQAIIKGVDGLSGAPVTATDLRASASLVLAGLAASGTTEVHDIHYIDRGYEAIEEKLNQLGAHIVRG